MNLEHHNNRDLFKVIPMNLLDNPNNGVVFTSKLCYHNEAQPKVMEQTKMSQKFGYARVSTPEQTVEPQIDALKKAGCDVIRQEKVSGKTRQGRTELETILDFIRSGDTLCVTRIDRLARNLKDLQDIVHDLDRRSISLQVIEHSIDTGTATGRAFLQMLGVFSEFEHRIREERQRLGILKAQREGKYKGKAPMDRTKIYELKDLGLSNAEIARRTKCTPMTVWRALKARGTNAV